MKKKLSILFALCLLASFLPFKISESFAASADIPNRLRIGLESKYKEVSEIKINNKTIAIGYEQNGAFVQACEISSETGFSVAAAGAWLDAGGADYLNYNEAVAASESYKAEGKNAAVGLNGGKWRVYFSGEGSDAGKIALSGASSLIIFDGINPQIKDNVHLSIYLGERNYRGIIEFGRYSGQKISAVNLVSMDEYLYGVVPSEMPSSWHSEALKAQSVAARSYAVTSVDQGKHPNFDLCDTIHCQVYLGSGVNESESTKQAVDATSGTMVYYGGKVINAVFFASSGGMTEDSENVWAYELPYFRGVKEINETTAPQWTQSFTTSELTELAAKSGADIGTVTDMKITKTGNTGRVLELSIMGSKGVKTLEKEAVRTFFAPSAEGSLISRSFTINYGSTVSSAVYAIAAEGEVVEIPSETQTVSVIGANGVIEPVQLSTVSTSNSESFTIVGAGNGHGVGLSQHGAKGMAELGYSYIDILKYYYTGVEVK